MWLPFSSPEERKLLTGGVFLSFLWIKSLFLLHNFFFLLSGQRTMPLRLALKIVILRNCLF